MDGLKERLEKEIAEKEAVIREIKSTNKRRAFQLFKQVLSLKAEITAINKFKKFK